MAYLRAVMHADSNIQYANYQNLEQMTNCLTIHGHADSVALILNEIATGGENVFTSSMKV